MGKRGNGTWEAPAKIDPRSRRYALPRGELTRTYTAEIVGSERSARRVVAALVDRGILVSDSVRAPLRLVFSVKEAYRWMPGLFPPERT